jgi:hypothetical protein
VIASAGFAGAAAVLVAVALVTGCDAAAPSGPAPSPRITCVGVPSEKCDEAVASVERSLPNETPESIDVTCVSGGCTSTSGAMDTVVTLPGGRQLHSTPLTWGGGGGAPGPAGLPALPVLPVCVGVPDAMCRQNAGGDVADAGIHGGVVKIVVTCSKNPCTDLTGEGDTVITFGDGTTQTIGWGYATAQ